MPTTPKSRYTVATPRYTVLTAERTFHRNQTNETSLPEPTIWRWATSEVAGWIPLYPFHRRVGPWRISTLHRRSHTRSIRIFVFKTSARIILRRGGYSVFRRDWAFRMWTTPRFRLPEPRKGSMWWRSWFGTIRVVWTRHSGEWRFKGTSCTTFQMRSHPTETD